MAKVVLYRTVTCPYCMMAERLLAKKGVKFEEIDVTDDPEKREWLLEATSQRTVPQIFINDTPVGGYTDLAALDRAGELDKLLAAEPV